MDVTDFKPFLAVWTPFKLEKSIIYDKHSPFRKLIS